MTEEKYAVNVYQEVKKLFHLVNDSDRINDDDLVNELIDLLDWLWWERLTDEDKDYIRIEGCHESR